jgi:hypothetical protein
MHKNGPETNTKKSFIPKSEIHNPKSLSADRQAQFLHPRSLPLVSLSQSLMQFTKVPGVLVHKLFCFLNHFPGANEQG